VLDYPDGNRTAQDGLEAARLGLDRLPDVAVKTTCGHVQEDADALPGVDQGSRGVEDGPVDLIALAFSPPVALLNVHRPPRCIKVVERRQPLLNVDAGPELGGRADNDPRQAVVGSLEQAEARFTRLRFVNETDFVGRDATRGELALQV